jgi:hypothetical protein
MRRSLLLTLVAALLAGGCTQYRLALLEDVEFPTYEPREVAVPVTCDALIARAVAEGMREFSEADAREVLFCQQQMIIRSQEEEAAAKLLEAHAAAARFALQSITFAVTGLVAVLAWIF